MNRGWRLYGSQLSPFSVKVSLAARAASLDFRLLPEDGTRAENVAIQVQRLALKAGVLKLTGAPLHRLDELPLVPFLFGPAGERLYDSTAIVEFLDRLSEDTRFIPREPLACALARLLDEMFDEVGLYVLHHHRWVTSGLHTRVRDVALREFGSLVPQALVAPMLDRFEARQVRRLPYLFSVAPPSFSLAGLPAARQPASRPGFPPTHALLNEIFERMLDGLSDALALRPYLLGDSPCIADFSAGGMMLSMLEVDPSSAAIIESRAPRVATWARRMSHAGTALARRPLGEGDELSGLDRLCRLASDVFVPLMRKNEREYRQLGGGARDHNERAFDEGRSLFHGQLLGHPYRTVVKTFQVRVWRSLGQDFSALSARDHAKLSRLVPALER